MPQSNASALRQHAPSRNSPLSADAARLPRRTPGAIRRAVEVEAAYAERARRQRAEVTAERAEAGVL